jgi:hypothetical protein
MTLEEFARRVSATVDAQPKWQSPTRRDNPHYSVASLRITSVRGLGLTVLCPGNSRLFLCADRRLKLRQTLRTSKGDALQIFSASVSHAGGLDEAVLSEALQVVAHLARDRHGTPVQHNEAQLLG